MKTQYTIEAAGTTTRTRRRAMRLVTGLAALTLLPAMAASGHASAEDGPQAITAQGASAAGMAHALPQSRLYRIGVDDVLAVSVWHEPDLSRSVPVRPDGKISLPLVGEVQAAGKTPPQLEGELRTSMAQFVKNPELTVIVSEIRSQRVNIIGQVMHPGTFSLTQTMGVLDAISLAGGLRDFAKKSKIYVLRETDSGHRTRLSFKYKDVVSGKSSAQDIVLQPNDTVVVP